MTVRLKAVLSELSEGQPPDGHGAVAQKMESASADEVFDFIDKGV